MADLHHGRLWPNTCVPHDAISLTGRKGPYMRTRGETKDAGRRRTPSHLKHEGAQNLLVLRCEATAEPRRRGGFATVPLAGEVGEPQRAGWGLPEQEPIEAADEPGH